MKRELPEIRNRVCFYYHIDGTPEGYALRILQAYREKTEERWEVSGLSEEQSVMYDLMNQHQEERAEELDKAIKVLEKYMEGQRDG